jgi:hypothetical protein
MLTVRLQVFDTLRRREDEHHRNDGHSTESLKRERHSKFILNHGPSAFWGETFISLPILDKIRLNLFKSRPRFNIFP